MAFSWLPINKNWVITSNLIFGRLSIIARIDFTGHYLRLLANSTINLNIFQHYLCVLKSALHAEQI